MADVQVSVMQARPAWLDGAARWNRRVSLTLAVTVGLATSLLLWALTIKAGSWFGVFLGWWPAIMIGAIIAFIVGRAWPLLLLATLALLVSVGPRPLWNASAAAAESTLAAVSSSHHGAAKPMAMTRSEALRRLE